MGLSENGIAASSPDSVILSSCSLGSLLFPDSLQTQVCVVFLSGNTMYILWMGFSKHVGLPESNYVYVYVYTYIYIHIHSIYTYSIPGKIPAFLLSAFRQSGASQVRVATARDQHLWRPGFPPYGAVVSGCWWVRVWSIHTILGVQSFSERGTAMPG